MQTFGRVLQRGGNVWDTGGINLKVPGVDFQVNSATTLYFDFDNDEATRNTLDFIAGVDSAKSPIANEAGYAQGDSGGPNFINKEIAGVTSFSIPSPLNVPFYAGNPDSYSKFGDVNGSEWVAKHLNWIDQIMTAPHPLVLDMRNQPGGNDGRDDRILVRRIGNTVQLVVNDLVFHSDPIDRVTSIQLIGSNDNETFQIQDDIDLNTRIDGSGGESHLVIANDLGGNRATRIELFKRQASLNNQGLLRGIFFSPMSTLRVEGDRLDTLDIRETVAGSPVVTHNVGRVNIGKDNTSDSILANITVLNNLEGTELTIDGIDSGPSRPITLTPNFVTGIAPVRIDYPHDGLRSLTLNGGYTRKNDFVIDGTPYKPGLSDGGSVRINGGYKSDSVTINSSSTYLQFNGKAGSDSVHVGRLVKPSLLGLPDRSTSEIDGPIVVANSAGLTKLQVIDSSSGRNHQVTMGTLGELGYIQGMLHSSASISYFAKQTSSVTVKTGNGSDTFVIDDTASRKGRTSAIGAITELFKTEVLAGDGNDTANVLGNSGILTLDLEGDVNSVSAKGADGTLAKIAGSLSVMASDGTLALLVSDASNNVSREFYVTPSVISYQLLNSLRSMDIAYRDATSVQLDTGKKSSTVYVTDTNATSRTAIRGGADSDRIFVRGTTGEVSIDAGGGVLDTLDIGSEQNTLDALRGPVFRNHPLHFRACYPAR